MGRKQHLEPQLFYPGFCLNQRIGIDNRYRRICQAVDFDFVRPAVEHLYGDVGNPSVDPIVVLKLMIIAFVENITSERELIRVCQSDSTGCGSASSTSTASSPIIRSPARLAADGASSCSSCSSAAS